MAEIRQLVCDQCGAGPAATYGILAPGKAIMEVDLCDQCDQMVIALAAKGRPPAGKRRGYRRYQVTKPRDTPRKAEKAP